MISWHYPRQQFAEFIINGMEQGLLQRVSIFAPRKRGKTQFIQYDVIPICHDRGILPIYIDFWLDKNNPQAVFIKSVQLACQRNESFLKKLSKRVFPNKVGISASKQSLELGFEQSKEVPEVSLLEVFKQLEDLDVPVLLLLDEVQHLATDKSFETFTAALRSFMVNRGDQKVKGIFTGSSREGLNQLFKNSQAPFYNSNQTLDFSALDKDFVEYELNVFEKVTGGVKLNVEEAMTILIVQNRAPARFVEMLQAMVLNKVHDLREGQALYDNELPDSQGSFITICGALQPLDLTLLKLIAMNQAAGIYTEKGMQKLRLFAENDELAINKAAIKNALNRLKSANHIYSPSRGKWVVENPEFKDYLLQP